MIKVHSRNLTSLRFHQHLPSFPTRRSSDLGARIVFVLIVRGIERVENDDLGGGGPRGGHEVVQSLRGAEQMAGGARVHQKIDRKSTRLNSSHANISYAVFCLKNKRISSSWQ